MISQIGKYRILGELGRGGMGRVYRAYDPDVNRHVAIKVLEAEADPELLRRFKAEIDTTGSLQHKNIVTAFECGEDSGVPYLVMELLAGQTLEKIIKENTPLLLLDKVRIMNEVAHGLSFAHSRGVIHRDVKPGNIMRLPDATVKIMDFGIARVATRKTVMTQEGFIFGTVPYMAPEQFEPGGKADQQTDIFSYADVYYELLTGKQPFAVPNEIYPTIQRIKTLEPEGVSHFVPGCPEGLELLVHRAMAKDREIRYETFAELLLDNEAVLLDLERELAAQMLDEVRPVLEAGDLERAEALLAKVLKLDPGSRDGRELWRNLRSRTDEHRFSGRIAELLLTSETQVANRQFAEAVQTLETALRIKKNDEKVRRKLAEANEKLAAQLAANKVVAEVRKLLQKTALPEALERVEYALKLDPQHTDALLLKPRIEAEIGRRQEEEIERGISKSQTYLEQKNYIEALSALPVTFKEPARERIAQLRAAIERQKVDHDREVRAQRLNLGVSKLQESLQNQDIEKAAEQIRFLKEHFSDLPGAPATLAELQAQLDALARAIPVNAAKKEAKEFAERREFAEALQVLDSALQRFPDERTLFDLRREVQTEFDAQRRAEAVAHALEQVGSLRDAGKLREASDALAAYRQRIGEDSAFIRIEGELQRALEEERYREGLATLLERSRRLTEGGRLAEAIAAIEAAPQYTTEANIAALLASTRSSLARQRERAAIDSAIENAKRAERDGDPGRALTILTHAIEAFPHAEELSQAAEELKATIEARRLEQRRRAYEITIRKSIDRSDWTEAQSQLASARHEFPNDEILDKLARKIEDSLHDLRLEQLAGEIREKLAANRIADVSEDMNRTAAFFASDPRWQLLQKEVSLRKVYEASLAEAANLLARRNYEGAEAKLNALIKAGAPDDRALRMIADIEAARLAEATEEIAQLSEKVRALLQKDALDEARSVLAQGKAKHPNEKTWLALETEIAARKRFVEALQQADDECRRGDYESADRSLRALQPSGAPDAERVRSLARAIADSKQRKAREDSIAAATSKLATLKQAADLQALSSFLETIRKELPDERALQQECQLAITELNRRKDAEQKAAEQARAQQIEAKRREAERKEAEQKEAQRIEAERKEIERQKSAKREAQRQKTEKARKQETPEKPTPTTPVEPIATAPPPPITQTPPVAPPTSASKTPWLLGAAGITVALIAAGLYWRSTPTPQPQAPAPPSLATVRVTSEPAGASISLRNESCTTPCALKVPTGSHTLSARLDGYEPAEQTVAIGEDKLRTGADVRVELRTIPTPPPPEPPTTAAAGKVEISVNQDGAMVLVDGQRYGVANPRKPLVVSLETGEHKIRVEKLNHTSADQSVRVAAGETRRVSVDLRPLPGRLNISGALPDVQVAVDGAPRGRTSSSGSLTLEVPPGMRVVRLTRDTYAPREETVQVGPNQTVSLSRTQVELTKVVPDRLNPARVEYARLPNDADRLEEFAEKFKGTPEAAEARKRADALREQARKEQAAKEEAAKLQAKEQAAKEQAAKEQALRERREREAKDKRAILDALARYRAAYAGKDAEALRSVWTNVPGATLDGIRRAFRAYKSITVDLQPTGEPTISEDTARVTCRRTVTNVGGPNHPPDVVTFRLQRSGAGWVISGIE